LDPWFSDTMAPGPGSPLLGDSGRMLMFEAGPDGVQTKLLMVQANILEGILLGIGSVALFTCFFTSRRMQLVTTYCAPVSACYFLVNIVYFPLTGAPELAAPMLVLGVSPVLISLYRVHAFLPPSWQKVGDDPFGDGETLYRYYSYIALLLALLLGGGKLIAHNAQFYADDIALFIRVRDHFTAHNFTWSAGLPYPDGFQLEPKAKSFFGLF